MTPECWRCGAPTAELLVNGTVIKRAANGSVAGKCVKKPTLVHLFCPWCGQIQGICPPTTKRAAA